MDCFFEPELPPVPLVLVLLVVVVPLFEDVLLVAVPLFEDVLLVAVPLLEEVLFVLSFVLDFVSAASLSVVLRFEELPASTVSLSLSFDDVSSSFAVSRSSYFFSK